MIVNNQLKDILSDPNKNIENMSKKELILLKNEIIGNPNNYGLIEKSFEKTSTIHNLKLSDVRNPAWFYNNTKFESNIWMIKLNKLIITINFNKIKIDNNILLTERPNILNTFKYWLCIQSHPIYNEGLLLKTQTISINLKNIIYFINSILVNSNILELSKYGLNRINEDYIVDYLVNISNNGKINASINYNIFVTDFLKEKIKEIDINDVIKFEEEYPFFINNNNNDELDLTLEELRKSKYWIYCNEGYSTYNPNKVKKNFFIKSLEDRIIVFNQQPFTLNQLNLIEDTAKTEYLCLPYTTSDEEHFSYQELQSQIKNLKKILFVHSQNDCAQINISNFNTIGVKRINKITPLKDLGRFATLPADVTFKAIRDSFEFIHKHLDILLDTIIKYSLFIKNKEGNFDDFYNSSKFPSTLKKIGIKELKIPKDENYFINLRNNHGFIDFYNILLASILVALGAITARRNSEIIDLHPLDCLLPQNFDPLITEFKEFEVIFDNRKSGVGGINFHHEKMSRPIPSIIAKIIYKLKNFNEIILENNFSTLSDINLINNYSYSRNTWKKLSPGNYSNLLNLFCDYFQTKKIEYSQNEYRRYYIRQHQLRRFFAMIFFWSKSFDGLDTLRHFLGHTDIEHLYHYITEPLTGSVLNGVKSHTITEAYLGVSGPIVKNIEDLRTVLLNHFNVNDLEITSMKNFNFTNKLSSKIHYLIDEHIIDLQPRFFTTKDKNNNIIQEFELILIVKDEI
ncbi:MULTISPECIES: hypothetical protein [Acinetobacter calcoaceticus/baumannii complex]|uniref:hypothetical protein n=1 Tax=Acinetobacter calcoaceticus/baumannii complex TaxID=909768 RepID=UPI00044908E4|nr:MULTISPECIES: hypothetical protein [Acinetobacter calcoaceticus/baumannii complex]MCT9382504.1 hypothetical protein [Acinetobacter baumannii]EXH76185.1 hypothetical protein J633_2172 [Acinetobacter sp. 216872]MCG9487333.1 hypothetical protein [Acinetobacter pittii]MCG9503662.1 hypothetical protein [Acinetobacter pittii]MCT9479727.1 hypothetical protein [Acinetobacter baumannii]